MCRTLAYVKERLILYKQEGREWAIKNTDIVYREIISKALSAYKLADKFVSYMHVEISSSTTIEFRLAILSDLDNIKKMYKEIVEKLLKTKM